MRGISGRLLGVFGVIVLSALPVVATPGAAGVSARSETRQFSAEQTEQIIDTIRQDFREINRRADGCRKVEKTILGRTTEGGGAVGYFCGDDPDKIVMYDYGETGRAVTEYYLRDGQLIFVFREEYDYDRPIYEGGGQEVARIQQDRYYVWAGALVRWLDASGRTVDPAEASYEAALEDHLKEVRFLTQELKAAGE